MKFATSTSDETEPGRAVTDAFSKLCARLGAEPDYVVVAYTDGYDAGALALALDALPARVRVHAGSSSLGLMTEAGYASRDGQAFGMMGFLDREGAFGVAAEPLDPSPREAAARALRRAIERAARPGEAPALVWLSVGTGSEEDVLRGIEDVVGPHVPVFGGTTAASSLEGGWTQIERGAAHTAAALVSAIYPSDEVSYFFSGGYAPTEHRGRVTKGGGRRIEQIDGEPAAVVYNRWSNGLIESALGGGGVVHLTAFNPIGRVAASVGDVPYYTLIFPCFVDEAGALVLTASVPEGDEVVLMSGSRESLVARGPGVAKEALEAGGGRRLEPAGALVTYCGGCMMAVRDQMPRVAEGIREALGGVPFLGSFTFGEQGALAPGVNCHGNLLISVVAFGSAVDG